MSMSEPPLVVVAGLALRLMVASVVTKFSAEARHRAETARKAALSFMFIC